MNNKTYSSLELLIIFILLGLNTAVIINGINLKCDKCTINFIDEYKEFNVKIIDLYKSYKNNKCLVKYSNDLFINYDKNG